MAVLVTYTTREAAEAVAVDAMPLPKVRDLDGRRMVVLGAPLCLFPWHRDTKGFLAWPEIHDAMRPHDRMMERMSDTCDVRQARPPRLPS